MRAGFMLTDVDHPAVDTETRWFARHPDYLDRTFKRGERYLHHIVTEIEARKLPLELALLPIVESAFNPVAYSRARASGLWQFIPATGRRYGLKQNWYYDGRRDVLAATTAALDYLEFLAAEFDGDWLLAVAAYNTGEANVARAIRKNLAAGKPTDFFSLKLPRETRAYVPKLLAMRRLVQDPAAHGLAFAPIPNKPYFVKVDVGGQIDLHVASELAELAKEEMLAVESSVQSLGDRPGRPASPAPADRSRDALYGSGCGPAARQASARGVSPHPPRRHAGRHRGQVRRLCRGDPLGQQDPRLTHSSGAGPAHHGRAARRERGRRRTSRRGRRVGACPPRRRQARRTPRRDALEHRPHSRREHGLSRRQQRAPSQRYAVHRSGALDSRHDEACFDRKAPTRGP